MPFKLGFLSLSLWQNTSPKNPYESSRDYTLVSDGISHVSDKPVPRYPQRLGN